MNKIRSFIAVPVSTDVLGQVERLQHGLRNVRWSDISTIHLTLAFLGDVDVHDIDALTENLELLDFASFDLRLLELGFFMIRGQIGPIWIGLEEQEKLSQLKKDIDRIVRSVGIPLNKQKFHPHITIGRAKEVPPHKMSEFIEQKKVERLAFSVDRFHLYQSVLTKARAQHTVLGTYYARQ